MQTNQDRLYEMRNKLNKPFQVIQAKFFALK